MSHPHYVGTLQRSFKQAVIHLLETDYGLLGSGRVLSLLADDLQQLADQFHPPADHLQSGWLVFTGTKASGSKPHPGQSGGDHQLVTLAWPVLLPEDIQALADLPSGHEGRTARSQLTRKRLVRLIEYGWQHPQGPVLHYQFDPVQTTKTSVHGSINMLGLAKRVKAKILLASTSEIYGDPQVHPQPETYWGHVNPIGLRACYDEGKRCAETLFFDYYRQHKLRIKVARNFNTYGPRMHPNDGRVVSNFIMQALKGEEITVYGDGSQTRSFCYVDDLIDGLLLMIDTGRDFPGPRNLGNPEEFTILQLAEQVLELTVT